MRISDWSSDLCSSYLVHYPDAPACAVTSQCPRTNADGTTQNLSGRPLANVPRWTAAAVPSLTTLLPGGALAILAVDVMYRSDRRSGASWGGKECVGTERSRGSTYQY